MGWIDRFLSRAVVTGFLIGAAIHVVIDELPKLAGLCGLPPGFFAGYNREVPEDLLLAYRMRRLVGRGRMVRVAQLAEARTRAIPSTCE